MYDVYMYDVYRVNILFESEWTWVYLSWPSGRVPVTCIHGDSAYQGVLVIFPFQAPHVLIIPSLILSFPAVAAHDVRDILVNKFPFFQRSRQ